MSPQLLGWFVCIHMLQGSGALEVQGLPSQGLRDKWHSAFLGDTERLQAGEGTDYIATPKLGTGPGC